MSPSTLPSICDSCFVSPLNPVTWLHPVIPGFTKWRIMYLSISFEYSSVCLSICGRGPTTLMSPFSTFQNCGISSMFVFLIMSPHLVFLGSSFVACSLSASAFTFMLRNL